MSPSAVTKEIGLNNSSSTAWKRGALPKGETLKKLADYFGVSIDPLLSDGLIEHIYNMGISDFYSLSHDAMQLAEDYDNLDYWGKKQVRTTTNIELERVHHLCEETPTEGT